MGKGDLIDKKLRKLKYPYFLHFFKFSLPKRQ